jgi:hypothetical protein
MLTDIMILVDKHGKANNACRSLRASASGLSSAGGALASSETGAAHISYGGWALKFDLRFPGSAI